MCALMCQSQIWIGLQRFVVADSTRLFWFFFRFDTYALFLDRDFLTQASLVFIKIICVFSLSVHVVVCSYKLSQSLSASIYRVVVVGTQFYQLRYTL